MTIATTNMIMKLKKETEKLKSNPSSSLTTLFLQIQKRGALSLTLNHTNPALNCAFPVVLSRRAAVSNQDWLDLRPIVGWCVCLSALQVLGVD